MRQSNNIILNSLSDACREVDTISSLPAGSIAVNLSTKGKVGAPETIHVRNFKVSEIFSLSLSDGRELPIRLSTILNDMIYEDVDVREWHEREVEELMIYIFMTYYRGVLKDVPFTVTEDDVKYIMSQPNGTEQLEALRDGKWVPKTDINIAGGVSTYDLDDSFNPRITITNKKTGFHVTFDYIKYGDQIKIRNWVDSYFKGDEERFSVLRKQLEYNQGITNQLLDNPEKIDKLISIDPQEEEEYREYLSRRAQAITDISHIVSIVDFDGVDTSSMSLTEKYEMLSRDARIDYNLITKLSQRQLKNKFGLKPDVAMRNPITGEVVKRPVSFRIPAILQALQLSETDDYDDGYDDEA